MLWPFNHMSRVEEHVTRAKHSKRETKAGNMGRVWFAFDPDPMPLAVVPPLAGEPVVKGQPQRVCVCCRGEGVGKRRQELHPCAQAV